MKKIWENDYEIEWFGMKLISASKSINKIPEEYLSYSQNARVHDWWIVPRKWNILFTNSSLWSNNKWAFILKNKLHQIANSKIYEIDQNGNQIEKADLWYDAKTSILSYNAELSIIASEGERLKIYDWNTLVNSSRDQYVKVWYHSAVSWEEIPEVVRDTDLWWSQSYCGWYVKARDEKERVITLWLRWDHKFIIWEDLKANSKEFWTKVVFEWVTKVEYEYITWWIIEFAMNRSFVAQNNLIYVSKELQTNDLSTLYDFNWEDSVRIITCDSKILWLKRCLWWLYIFTEKSVE